MKLDMMSIVNLIYMSKVVVKHVFSSVVMWQCPLHFLSWMQGIGICCIPIDVACKEHTEYIVFCLSCKKVLQFQSQVAYPCWCTEA